MTAEDAGPIRSREDALARQDLIFKDTFPGSLGVRIVDTSRGHAVGELEIGPRALHPGGYAHAGALAGFGDTVAAWATLSSLDPGEDFTTIEFKSNFITGVREGRLRAEANVVHRGKRTMVVEVKVRTAEDEPRLVSMMIVTQAVLKRAE